LPLLLGQTLEAALAADSRQAERWDVPGAHSHIYSVRGYGPRASAPELVLKMARIDESRAFLRRERRALQRLQGLHCVVQPTAWVQCTDGGPGGFLMPFCAAFPVEACVSRPDTAVAFLGKVTDALARLHACDVAHGDLKPDVFRTDGATSAAAAALSASALPPLRLMDFNLSLSASARPQFARDRHWGTPPYCLGGWAPRSGAAVDCVALSSLLAQWCNLPASVGGPGGPLGVSDFAERLEAVRALVHEWQHADLCAPTAERAWQFKALALQLMLLERCEELSLQTIWQVWLHEFWLPRREARLSLLGSCPEDMAVNVRLRACSGGLALTCRNAQEMPPLQESDEASAAREARACLRRPLTLLPLQNDGPRRRDAESSKREPTPVTTSARAPLSDLTLMSMR
jgi:tRNA A-37 threonylcarbamoyl transferase component Bud32